MILAAAGIAACLPFAAAESMGPDPSPSAILGTMERVADWQLANPSKHGATDWTQAAGCTGMMALAGICGDSRYRDSMRAMGEAEGWRLGPRTYMADDHCIGQTYAELHLLYRENGMIAPLRERFDAILAAPSRVRSLEFSYAQGSALENWSWCDALFMGPPTWVRLYAATGDTRYLDFAVANWWRTTDYLYDKEEHLFYRDSTYFPRREANGRKVFWSRGNGWVMAGLVRTLQYLPSNHPDRPRFERLFGEMAEKILSCQQPDGLWRASLLDPASYPLKETSGSGFYVYALAWGVNQGLLERSRCEGAVRAGWNALCSCVGDDGRLSHVQPIGADPKRFPEDSTEVYGVGAFLLAGSEVYRMAVIREAGPAAVAVDVANPSPFRRESETVELHLRTDPARPVPGASVLPRHFHPKQPAVLEGVSSRIVPSQAYSSDAGPGWDTLVFQVDLGPDEKRRFLLLDAAVLAGVPAAVVRTYARQVPERFNDMAWESDRTAHRAYQQALIQGEGTVSSGIDVWSKRTRRMVIDEWYRNGDYHNDHGDGMDDYRVGPSRGCGGLGIWDGSRLHVSSNFRGARVLTTGPVRSEFELTYDAWDAGGTMVSETRRVCVDAGSNLCRASSVFSSDVSSPVQVGIGIAQRAGEGGTLARSQPEGWMAYWQPPDRDRGNIACAVIVPEGVVAFATEKGTLPAGQPAGPGAEGYPPVSNELAIAPAQMGKPFVYFFGSTWSKSGDFPGESDWEGYVRRYRERIKTPLEVTMEPD
ncbi:MAG TPA: glycoside hydrolase family 88 protein [Opitutaceae bacterium]